MCDLHKRLAAALEICLRVRTRFAKGAPNINEQPELDKQIREKCQSDAYKYGFGQKPISDNYKDWKDSTRLIEGTHHPIKWILANYVAASKSSKEFEAGTCGAQSRYVFLKFYRRGLFPIDLVAFADVPTYEDHEMVVVGLPPAVKPMEDLRSFTGHTDVVICDPWMMMLLEAKAGRRTGGAYSVGGFIEHTQGFLTNYTIERVFRMDSASG